jgi:hypothetical protein
LAECCVDRLATSIEQLAAGYWLHANFPELGIPSAAFNARNLQFVAIETADPWLRSG